MKKLIYASALLVSALLCASEPNTKGRPRQTPKPAKTTTQSVTQSTDQSSQPTAQPSSQPDSQSTTSQSAPQTTPIQSTNQSSAQTVNTPVTQPIIGPFPQPAPSTTPQTTANQTPTNSNTSDQEDKQTTQVAVSNLLNIAADVADIVHNHHNPQAIIHDTQGIVTSILNIVAAAVKRSGTNLDQQEYIALLCCIEKELQDLVIAKKRSLLADTEK